jgi:hypothetical protein
MEGADVSLTVPPEHKWRDPWFWALLPALIIGGFWLAVKVLIFAAKVFAAILRAVGREIGYGVEEGRRKAAEKRV